MTTPNQCCAPCPTVETVNTPGIEGPPGDDGTNGADGIDAFTFTTADFTVPAVNANVAVSVVNNAWMVVGQPIFVAGPAHFLVAGKTGSTVATLTFKGYVGDVSPGATITTGAGVSPAGIQGAGTLIPALSDYHVGGAGALTTTPTQLLGSQVTLAAGTYLLFATCRLDFAAASFAASQTVTIKLRETTNGPADLANAVVKCQTGIVTTITQTLFVLPMPPVSYAAAAGDTVQVFGDVGVAPGAGALNAVEVAILAIKLF